MKFSRRLFLIAGVYGLVCLLPLYFLESSVGEQDPPAITHPEFFYGFVGVAVAWQVLFLMLSRNPLAYRPLIVPAILMKLSFGGAVLVLLVQGRISSGVALGGLVDLVFAALFANAYILLGRIPARSDP
jgi:hypothetical protein